MNTTELKKFAQSARRQLIEQIGAKLDLVLQDVSAVLRDQEKALQQLRDEIANSSRNAVIDRVAYIRLVDGMSESEKDQLLKKAVQCA